MGLFEDNPHVILAFGILILFIATAYGEYKDKQN